MDTTTSDNTSDEDTCKVAIPTVGCVKIERLGNAMWENTVCSWDTGTDHALSGVSIYLVFTSDSLTKYSWFSIEGEVRHDYCRVLCCYPVVVRLRWSVLRCLYVGHLPWC